MVSVCKENNIIIAIFRIYEIIIVIDDFAGIIFIIQYILISGQRYLILGQLSDILIMNGIARTFWQSIGSNDIINEVLSNARMETYEKLESLMQGNSVVTHIDTG